MEALFDIKDESDLLSLLSDSGIDCEPNSELIIRREIHISGKNRAFINNQMAQITLLRRVGSLLFEIVGQHANQKLLSLDCQRQILDTFGGLVQEAAAFSKSWSEENNVRKTLETLVNTEAQRLREIETCRLEIEELLEANIKEGEEEELFAEYSFLSNSEELIQKVSEITHALDGERPAILSLLNRQKILFEQLKRLDPSLTDTAQTFENALLELQEVAHTLRNYQSRIEQDPARLTKINERLTLINHLKRKYGQNVQAYLTNAQTKLAHLENADNDIDALKHQLTQLQEQNQRLCAHLTSQRDHVGKSLEKAMIVQLQALNMTKAEFEVELSAQPHNRYGNDKIEFFLIPNVGEKRISIKDCASGGELSRLMLALQTLLAGKEKIPTLIFDEIDSNIGGETASIVGEKLKEIGLKHQILCITHFPQVAKCAQHHLQISKQEKEGRTVTTVKSLEGQARQRELTRMLGGRL